MYFSISLTLLKIIKQNRRCACISEIIGVYLTVSGHLQDITMGYWRQSFSIIIKRSLLQTELIDIHVYKNVFNLNIADPAAESFILALQGNKCLIYYNIAIKRTRS
jgi:hypothetical protein